MPLKRSTLVKIAVLVVLILPFAAFIFLLQFVDQAFAGFKNVDVADVMTYLLSFVL